MKTRNILFLSHILEACDHIMEFIKDKNFENFK